MATLLGPSRKKDWAGEYAASSRRSWAVPSIKANGEPGRIAVSGRTESR
jgi:hypothetical protein